MRILLLRRCCWAWGSPAFFLSFFFFSSWPVAALCASRRRWPLSSACNGCVLSVGFICPKVVYFFFFASRRLPFVQCNLVSLVTYGPPCSFVCNSLVFNSLGTLCIRDAGMQGIVGKHCTFTLSFVFLALCRPSQRQITNNTFQKVYWTP